MKRIISIILILIMVSSGVCSGASANFENAAYRLEAFDVMDFENPDRQATRAEAVTALVKLVYGNAQLPVSNPCFIDVPAEHKDAGYIYYAKELGYVSGVSNSSFEPSSPITLTQFLKVGVCILGYRDIAEGSGSWPNGYISVASKIGMLKSAELSGGEYLTAGDVAVLMDNMLDCHIADNYSSPGNYEISTPTLLEQIKNRDDFSEFTGVVRAAGSYTIDSAVKCEKDEIVIGSRLMQYKADNPLELLGKKLTVIYRDSRQDRFPVVMSINGEEYRELIVKAEDISTMTSSAFSYYTADDKVKTVNYESDITKKTVLYNGGIDSDFSKLTTIPSVGSVRLLDNDMDNDYDIIFIETYESFIVDRKSETSTTLYLKNNKTFNGKSGIWFDFDDSDKTYEIISDKGDLTEFTDIAAGDVISVFSDENEEKIKVIISRASTEGSVTGKDGDNNAVYINEEEFKIYLPNKSEIMVYGLGEEGTFLLNHENMLIGTSEPLRADGTYAYIEKFSPNQGFDKAKLRLIPSGTSIRTSKMNNSTGIENITYTYLNGKPEIIEFADKVNLTLADGTKQRVNSSELTSTWEYQFNKSVIHYKTNDEGQITSATLFAVGSAEYVKANYTYRYNPKLNSYAISQALTPFFVKDTTQLICVPESLNPSLADFEVELSVGGSVNASHTEYIMPIKIDADTQIAEAAVLVGTMDSSSISDPRDEDVAIVGSVSVCIDEKGEEYYKLEILNGTEMENPIMYADSVGSSVVKNLQCGDLIRYNKKATGEIGGVSVLAKLSTLGNSYDFVRDTLGEGYAYGVARRIELNRLCELNNKMIDKLFVTKDTTDTTGTEFSPGVNERYYDIDIEDPPTVYCYNRRSGKIRTAATEEIIDYENAGNGASELYIVLFDGKAKSLVILED